MSDALTLGERILWHRRRRGMSQEVLAGLIGRTEDWLSRVENDRIPVDRVPVLAALADALGIRLGDLLADDSIRTPGPGADHDLSALRHAITDYRIMSPALAGEGGEAPPNLDLLRRDVGTAWSAFQDSRYMRATRILPGVLTAAHHAARSCDGADRRRAQGLLAMAYQSAAMVLTKLGAADLAWVAADRGLIAAHESDSQLILGSLYRSVSHCLLANGRFDAATQLTADAGKMLRPALTAASGDLISVYGTLFLAGSMAAARSGDRAQTTAFLAEAGFAADLLGHDANRVWTAFGPTNVQIHRVATAMELGDVQIAIDQGPCIDTSALPLERRVRHLLEIARAMAARNQFDESLHRVLDAEEMAPEQVRAHFISRQLVRAWIRSRKGRPPTTLVDLAGRLHVI